MGGDLIETHHMPPTSFCSGRIRGTEPRSRFAVVKAFAYMANMDACKVARGLWQRILSTFLPSPLSA